MDFLVFFCCCCCSWGVCCWEWFPVSLIDILTVSIDALRLAVNLFELFRITATIICCFCLPLSLCFFRCAFVIFFLSFPAIKSVETDQVTANRLFQVVTFRWLWTRGNGFNWPSIRGRFRVLFPECERDCGEYPHFIPHAPSGNYINSLMLPPRSFPPALPTTS